MLVCLMVKHQPTSVCFAGSQLSYHDQVLGDMAQHVRQCAKKARCAIQAQRIQTTYKDVVQQAVHGQSHCAVAIAKAAKEKGEEEALARTRERTNATLARIAVEEEAERIAEKAEDEEDAAQQIAFDNEFRENEAFIERIKEILHQCRHGKSGGDCPCDHCRTSERIKEIQERGPPAACPFDSLDEIQESDLPTEPLRSCNRQATGHGEAPETEQDNLDPPLPKLLSCFVRIAPLVLIDEIEGDPAPLQKINTSELVTDDIEDYPAPSAKKTPSELVTDDIDEYAAPLQKINTSEFATDPIIDAVPDDHDQWLHRVSGVCINDRTLVSGGKVYKMSECGFDDDDWEKTEGERKNKSCCGDNLDSKHSACNLPQEMSDAAIDMELNQKQAVALEDEEEEAAEEKDKGVSKTVSIHQWRLFETGVPTKLSRLATKAHGHLVGSVAPPVEPIDLRYSDVNGQYVRAQLMQNLYHLQELSKANETPFIAEQITSAVAGCALWSTWRHSVVRPAYANKRRNYSRELFSVYDSLILLSGITEHSQAKAAEKLLADCLAIVHPQLIANRKEPEGYRYSVDCMGCVYWMPIRYTGDATVFDNVRSLIDAAPKPKRQVHRADLGHRFDHATPLNCS